MRLRVVLALVLVLSINALASLAAAQHQRLGLSAGPPVLLEARGSARAHDVRTAYCMNGTEPHPDVDEPMRNIVAGSEHAWVTYSDGRPSVPLATVLGTDVSVEVEAPYRLRFRNNTDQPLQIEIRRPVVFADEQRTATDLTEAILAMVPDGQQPHDEARGHEIHGRLGQLLPGTILVLQEASGLRTMWVRDSSGRYDELGSSITADESANVLGQEAVWRGSVRVLTHGMTEQETQALLNGARGRVPPGGPPMSIQRFVGHSGATMLPIGAVERYSRTGREDARTFFVDLGFTAVDFESGAQLAVIRGDVILEVSRRVRRGFFGRIFDAMEEGIDRVRGTLSRDEPELAPMVADRIREAVREEVEEELRDLRAFEGNNITRLRVRLVDEVQGIQIGEIEIVLGAPSS